MVVAGSVPILPGECGPALRREAGTRGVGRHEGAALTSSVEQARKLLSRDTAAERKSRLGQFLTPASTARFMADLFTQADSRHCRLLDPGAGIGSLASAFVERCGSSGLDFETIVVTAYEVDARLHRELEKTLAACAETAPLTFEILGADFIEDVVDRIPLFVGQGYTHAILNPPYKKIRNGSHHRLLLRRVGIETVNLYTAFVALTLELLAPGGEVVAIVPRSFCNGPYYRPFREFLLRRAAIVHLHLFESRTSAFKDDGVLQENVIIMLKRDGDQGDVTVTTSSDDSFSDLATYTHPFVHIVPPGNPERFIRIPTAPERTCRSANVRHSLKEIGLGVSTGPVVDFRLRGHLCDMPEPGTVPLLYPGHLGGHKVEWPKAGLKKPNAIRRNPETEKWLYPGGFYCVVRRFSSKEERRRIVPTVVEPDRLAGADMLGFENHLNVFHECRRGLPEELARGLAMYLRSSAVDEDFRKFSGHTQVNATDLRLMRYPSRSALVALGKWAMSHGEPTQAVIDELVNDVTA